MLENIVELIKSLAWPAAAIWISYIFRAEIRSLLSRISTLKYKEIEAKFEKTLTEAEAEVSKGVFKPTLPPPADKISKLDQLRRISEVSPRAAIMEAWILLEAAAEEGGFVEGSVLKRSNPSILIEHLIHSEKIPKNSIEIIKKLRTLRNQAAHLPEFVISQSDAERYLELAVQCVDIVKNIK